MPGLLDRHCKELPKGTPALAASEVARLLAEVTGWALDADQKKIARTYEFKNYHETIEFVNALAFVVHREDHHPDLEVSYNRCRVVFWTHTVGGVSDNDFICAARINALVT
jgi:4a-hydroxytetrahydrobiopterin dehydratase